MSFKRIAIVLIILFVLTGCSSNKPKKEEELKETFYMGTYEQDNNTVNGEEDIEWIILEKNDKGIIAISKYGLDNVIYSKVEGITSWEQSDLREWLNNSFYVSSFSDEEKQNIVQNKGDYVSILSVEEATNYFGNDEERSTNPTSFAISNGAHTYETQNLCWWWLKDVYAGQFVANVRTAGNISTDPNVYADDEGYTVRPVICLKTDTPLKTESNNTKNPNIVGKVNEVLFTIQIEDDDIGVYNKTSDDKVWKKNVFNGERYHVYETVTIDGVVWYRIGNGEWLKDTSGTRVSVVIEQ